MINQIFIINGSGGVGKDAFVSLVYNQACNHSGKHIAVANYSSVYKVKEIAKIIGWNGEKTERDRKFLSDLKRLTTEYNNMPLNDMKKIANNFMNYNTNIPKMLFLHIREPEEIAKAISEFEKYNPKTILIKRDGVKHIVSNTSDEKVYNYNYDITINNDGTLDDLQKKVDCFLDDFLNGNFQNQY